jgi:5-methylcytosine-specific restriction endonuclease McrA
MRQGSYRKQREALWRAGRRECHYCGLALTLARGLPESMTLDHKVPLSKGGPNHPRNYDPTCEPCNAAKGSMLEHEYRLALSRGVVFPIVGEKEEAKRAAFKVAMANARAEREVRRNQMLASENHPKT